jgi:hypothetical protein
MHPSCYRPQSILYEQFGAPALIYRNVSTWNTISATEKISDELFGNCLQIINYEYSGDGDTYKQPQYSILRPYGLHQHELCLSKIVFPHHNDHYKTASSSRTNILDLHSPIRQIVPYGTPDITQRSDTSWFMARTQSHCSVICVTHTVVLEEDTETDELSNRGRNVGVETDHNITEVIRIHFNNDDEGSTISSISQQPKFILKVGHDTPRYCTGYRNVSPSGGFSSPPPMFAVAGPKNTIHQLSINSSSPRIQSYTFEDIDTQKMIEYTFHPMILWSSAYYSNRNDFGNVLFQLDLRSSNPPIRMWSPSHANFMVDGLCCIRSFLQHPTKQHTAYATTSLGKLYELDARMPMRHVVTWTLPAEVDTYRHGNDMMVLAAEAEAEAEPVAAQGTNIMHYFSPQEEYGAEVQPNDNLDSPSPPVAETTIIAVQSVPLAYGLRVYQRPRYPPRFGTLPLESGPYSGISTSKDHSSIATSTVYPLPDFSPKTFYCGLASARIPQFLLHKNSLSFHNNSNSTQWFNDDREFSQSQTQGSALCVFLLTSLGDVYCHTLLECDRDKPRVAVAFDDLPLGVSAIPVPQSDSLSSASSSDFPMNIQDTRFLPIYLTNKYPLPSSAVLPFLSETDDINFYKKCPIPTGYNENEVAKQDGTVLSTKKQNSDSSDANEDSISIVNATHGEVTKSVGQLLTDHPLAHWEIQRYSGCSDKNVTTIVRDASIISGESETQLCFGKNTNDYTNRNSYCLMEVKHALGGVLPAAIAAPSDIPREEIESSLENHETATNTRYCVPPAVGRVSYFGSNTYKLPELNSKRSDLTKEKVMRLDRMWDE